MVSRFKQKNLPHKKALIRTKILEIFEVAVHLKPSDNLFEEKLKEFKKEIRKNKVVTAKASVEVLEMYSSHHSLKTLYLMTAESFIKGGKKLNEAEKIFAATSILQFLYDPKIAKSLDRKSTELLWKAAKAVTPKNSRGVFVGNPILKKSIESSVLRTYSKGNLKIKKKEIEVASFYLRRAGTNIKDLKNSAKDTYR